MGTSELVALKPHECLRLLRGYPIHVGRLGVTDEDGHPLIFPVNYRLDGDAIVVRTQPRSLLTRQAVGQRVSFEVDEVDPSWQDGWSVLVQGTAEPVTDIVELERLRRLRLYAWAPGDRSVYLRIQPTVVTGRRIT